MGRLGATMGCFTPFEVISLLVDSQLRDKEKSSHESSTVPQTDVRELHLESYIRHRVH
jgi:hypothetical protein